MTFAKRSFLYGHAPRFLMLVAIMVGANASGRAQTAREVGARNSSSLTIDSPKNEYGIWGGGSLGTTTFHIFAGDGGFDLLRLGYTRAVHNWKSATLRFSFDVVPVAILSYWTEKSPGGPTPACIAYGNCTALDVNIARVSTYGAGLSPIGFRANFRSHKRAQPFLDTSGGFILFPQAVPDSRGEKFNFTLDFGGGVQMFSSARRAVTLGYRYHHLSNGYRGQINPGFDSNVFYIGYSIFK